MNTEHKIQPGTECEHCVTHHTILDTLPERSLTEDEVHSLTDSEKTVLAEPINLMRGMVMEGVPDSVWATNNIVIATSTSARVLSLHEGYGWVVDIEIPLDCDCCTPEEHGRNVLLDHSEMLKQSTKTMMNGDPITEDDEFVRWAVNESSDI